MTAQFERPGAARHYDCGVFVKICGITSEADALLAVAMGADAVGFNFVPGSKRLIAPQRAGDIAKRLPPEVLTVGIFRDQAPKRVVEIVNRQGLGAAQLHGTESVEDTQYVIERVPRTMKVFVAGTERLQNARDWRTDPIMVDNAEGGSGESYDYRLALQAPAGLHVMLAGGLTPDNVADAIALARPWAVDVASGVESGPGVKDHKLVASFIKNAKAVKLAPQPRAEPTPSTAPYDWAADAAL